MHTLLPKQEIFNDISIHKPNATKLLHVFWQLARTDRVCRWQERSQHNTPLPLQACLSLGCMQAAGVFDDRLVATV